MKCLGGLKRVHSADICLGGLLCFFSKKTKIKYGFEDAISNVDLSSAAKEAFNV